MDFKKKTFLRKIFSTDFHYKVASHHNLITEIPLI